MKSPLILITISYIIGLLLGNYIFFSFNFLLLFSLVFLVFCVYLFLKDNYFSSHFILATIVLLGLTFSKIDEIPKSKTHIVNLKDRNVFLIGTINNEPKKKYSKNNEPKEKYSKKILVVNVEKVENSSAEGFVQVYVNKEIDLKYGDRVRICGILREPKEATNPGEFSYKNYLNKKGIYKIIYAKDIEKEGRGNFSTLKFLAIELKNKIVNVYKELFPEKYASLLGSIIFGSEASPISPEVEEKFRITGLTHILVASGAQITFFLLICFLLFGRIIFTFKKFITFSISLFLILFYALMTSGGVSILRAVIMGAIFLLGFVIEREYDAVNSLSIACLLILILSPSSLYDIGFQLSFATCFGIIYFSPKLIEYFKKITPKNYERLYEFSISLFSVCLSAQIMVIPLIAYHFYRFSFISLVANLFIVPLVCIILPLGIILGILGLLNLKLVWIFSSFVKFFLYLILKITYFFAEISFSSILIPSFSISTIIFYYLLVLILFQKDKISKEKLIIIFLFIFSFLISYNVYKNLSNNLLSVTFLDVGQGDSIFIKVPHQINILIDGGGSEYKTFFNPGEDILIPFLLKNGVKRIDLLILTHPHADHLEGLISVLKNLSVKQVLDSGQKEDEPLYEEFIKIIKEKNIPHKSVSKGEVINLGNKVKLYILNPSYPFVQGTKSDIDNNCVVSKLIYGKVSFLFTGDIQEEGENKILKEDLKSTVLKIAHHGSNTSSSFSFLEKVNPKLAVISVGRDNPFGHPHRRTLENLKNVGLESEKICRTDKNGAIIIKTDGEKIFVEKFKDKKGR